MKKVFVSPELLSPELLSGSAHASHQLQREYPLLIVTAPNCTSAYMCKVNDINTIVISLLPQVA